MQILFDSSTKVFHLFNDKISYVIKLFHENYVGHLYFGKRLSSFNSDLAFMETEREGAPQPDGHENPRLFSLDTLPQEYGVYGSGDYRIPAVQVRLGNGTSVLDFRYVEHSIQNGKVELDNLPSSYVENENDAMTLCLTLREVAGDLELKLYYTIFKDLPIITRHSVLTNIGSTDIFVNKLASICLDLLECNYERIHLYGAHAKERQIERLPLSHGIDTIASSRGATSHQHQNFLALVRPDTTEFNGEAIAATLVWSGNFSASTEVSSFENLRLVMGINEFDFNYCLEPNKSFTSPEGVLLYTDRGLNDMSHNLHKFVQQHIVRGAWQNKLRPVLVNSWEAAYFNFNEETILRFAKDAAKLGAELIVLDDGWFGKRDNDTSSLGDWTTIYKKKLPNGLKGLADKVHDLGVKFGVWIEPEMVSPDSELFRAHPDWILHVPGHKFSQQRNQYVLDLSRQDVRDYIVNAICTTLGSADIDYVKWDMNRNLTEIGSALASAKEQGQIAFRYVIGAYDLAKRITAAFPNVLFESCAGGGRRFDLGMLCYMPQVWTSDNTDAVSRQGIQYGTSLVFPPITMGAHVSAVPNHQVGRTTPLLCRFICAMSGNFGYEMDLGKLSDEDQNSVKEQIALYKKYRETIQKGQFTRLMSPFEGTKNETAWQFIGHNGTEIIAMYFKNQAQPAPHLRRLYLKDLDPNASYVVEEHLTTKTASFNPYYVERVLKGKTLSGSELMYAGITMDRIDADYAAILLVLRKVNA